MLKKTLHLFLISLLMILYFVPYQLVYADNFNIGFEPSCESILLVNLDTDSTVYSKNSDKKMAIASLTKIMVYVVVSDNVSDFDNTTVVVKDELLKSLLGTGSSLSGIKAGETLSILQLLHCLMIKSGNDAALVLADYVGNGDIGAFVQKMNDKAKDLGCQNTHFVNPHGLDDDDHYSTAEDLVRITKYAMTLPGFAETTSKVTSYVLGENRYPLVTTNSLIDPVRGGKYYCKYVKGIKTGSAAKAGKCLVSSAINNGYTYICVALGGFLPNDNCAMLDTKALYEWVFKNLELKPVVNKNKPMGEVKLNLAWQKDNLQLVPAKDYSVVLPKNVVASSIDVKIDKPDFVNAPIKLGQKIGTATLSYANTSIATIDLVAGEDVSRSNILFIIYFIKNIITSIWFKLTLIVALILLGFYIVMFIRCNKQAKRKRKTMKAGKYK